METIRSIYYRGRRATLADFINNTEYKRAEEALQQSEERYKELANSITDVFFAMDEHLRYTYWNKPSEIMTGIRAEDALGKSLQEIFPDALEIKRAVKVYRKVLRTQQSQSFLNDYTNRDGRHYILEINAYPSRGGISVFVKDITERKQAEEALRQSEENYRTLFDSAVIGTIVIDAETIKVVMANQAAAKMLGFSSGEEVIGLNPLEYVPPEDRERVRELLLKEFFKHDLRQTHELRMITKDGREIWISATGARIMHKGRLAGLASFTDITEKRQQNERLIMADRLASIGELVAGIAHELNNPLTSVIGFSQLLMEKDTPDYIRKDLAFIESEAKRAVSITGNLLTFARKHAPVKQLYQINNIIEDALKLRAYSHRVNAIKVESHLAPDLPEVLVDSFQMQQVFLNIIINAEYFMTEAHRRGTLTITTEKQNGSVMISFADDGPGIPLENLSRIFDPFFTTKGTGKGTGLGLSICHGIVAEHGGQIYARSQVGKGTTIFIELPIRASTIRRVCHESG